MVKRKSLIVYFKQNIVLNTLRNVHIYYTSKKYNYAIIYVDASNYEDLVKYLNSNPLVNNVIENDQLFEF